MELYLLEPKDKYKNDEVDNKENPWSPWYDKTFGFVIAAESEKEARKIADKRNHKWYSSHGSKHYEGLWLDDNYAKCINLKNINDKGIVLSDERWA